MDLFQAAVKLMFFDFPGVELFDHNGPTILLV